MEYITFKNSDIKVSKLCLGCMSFGEANVGQYQWTLDYDSSKKIIDEAIKLGINYFDTSNNYSNGTSEQFLGKTIKEYDRSKLVIESKCYFNEGKLSPEAIHRELSKSLNNLQTDYLDIYVMHRYDYDTKVEDTLLALKEELAKGRIRYYGLSAMYASQFEEYCLKAKELDMPLPLTLQNHYNLIYREDEKELIPLANKYGINRTPFSPFAAGRLSRKDYASDSLRFTLDSKEGTRYDKTIEMDKKIVERVYEISQKYNTSMTNVCLSWEFIKGNASVLIGITKLKYLEDAINCFSISLTEEDINYLDELYTEHPVNCNR